MLSAATKSADLAPEDLDGESGMGPMDYKDLHLCCGSLSQSNN